MNRELNIILRDKLTDKEKELYDELLWDLRAMYQNSSAMADNGIPFRDKIEKFMEEIADRIQSIQQCGHFIGGTCNRDVIAGVGKVSREEARKILKTFKKDIAQSLGSSDAVTCSPNCDNDFLNSMLDRLGFGAEVKKTHENCKYKDWANESEPCKECVKFCNWQPKERIVKTWEKEGKEEV